MEANICDTNHLDADVLLPPRKRLLAGLKRKNCDGNFAKNSISSTLSEFDIRLNNLLRSHLSNTNFSHEEIIEASREAAEAAARVAKAARAAAEEKAVIAAKAMAAAKKALEFVAIVDDETDCNERYSRKNKSKKHVRVKLLYNKNNCKTDEEIARKLHQTINSSPRITKNSSTSELKTKKQKRLKILSSDRTRVLNGVTIQSNGNGIACDVDSEGSVQEGNTVRVDENTSKFNKADQSEMGNGDLIAIQSKEKIGEVLEDTINLGRKRGRIKQKKLPLSVCNFRDQTNPKEDLKGKKPLFPAGPSGDNVMPVENTTMWKCKAFKASTSIKQNKIMQS